MLEKNADSTEEIPSVSELIETVTSSELLYEGRILNVRKDQVRLSDGLEAEREIVEHVPAVGIIPLHESKDITLIQQFRLATKGSLLEIPAGCMDAGENPLDAAKRELKEETGLSATKWTKLTGAFMAPGFCEEFMHIYLAEGLEQGRTDFDHDERIHSLKISYSQAMTYVESGEIKDAKTIVALLMTESLLAKR